MKLKVRTKIVFITILILFLAIGANAFISSYIFEKEYSTALQSEMFVIGQSLKLQLDKLLELGIPVEELLGFEEQCQEIVEQYEDTSYAMVEDVEGKILFHSDSLHHGKLFTEFTTSLEEEYSHLVIPVVDMNEQQVATVKIGYPAKLVTQKTQRLIMYSFLVAIVSLLVAAILLLSGFFVWITRPLKDLSQSATQLAVGDINCDIQNINSYDEIGILSRSFKQLILYFQEMAHVATEISQGDLSQSILTRSENDVLGQAFLNMSVYLNEMAVMASAVTEGDLTQTIHIRSVEDTFGQVIRSMTEGLRALIIHIRNGAEQIASIETGISSLTSENLGIAQDVSVSVKEMISTVREIAASVEEVADKMEELSSSVEETSASVAQMTPSIGNIVSNTNTLTQQIYNTREFLTETVRALEDIVKNTGTSKQLSQETIQDALEGQEAIEQVTTSMETLQETITTAMEAIRSFSQRSQDIGTILDVIQEITEQTSLLALNASIIAAQAGGHGRGFAVVADEIKNLAHGVTISTKDIAVIVQTLQRETTGFVQIVHEGVTNVEQGMKRTQQARDTLHKIITSAQRSSAVVTEISDELHRLMASSHNVATAIEQVKVLTDEIHMATNEQETSTVQINQAIASINDLASQTHQATQYQFAGLQQILKVSDDATALIDQNFEGSQKITQATKELASQADLLIQSVDRFKLNS